MAQEEREREGEGEGKKESTPPQLHVRSLVFNYLLFAGVGMVCSILYNSYYGTYADIDQKLHLFTVQQNTQFSLEEVRSLLQGTNCDNVEKEAKIPNGLKAFMGTKLRYQFEPVISDESTIGTCRALKVCCCCGC